MEMGEAAFLKSNCVNYIYSDCKIYLQLLSDFLTKSDYIHLLISRLNYKAQDLHM